MPSWRDDYLSALNERDKKEKANEAVYESCSSIENERIATTDKSHQMRSWLIEQLPSKPFDL